MIYLCNLVHAHVNEQKFMCQIDTVIPTVLTNAFHSTNLFLVFVLATHSQQLCKFFFFSAYKKHTTHNSSNYFMVSLFVWFLSSHYIDKNLLVPCMLFYSSQLVNRNCIINHLYFLHVPTTFNHFWNSVFPRYNIKLGHAFSLKLLLL